MLALMVLSTSGIAVQGLFTHALHEVAQDTLDGPLRERGVVLCHVNGHLVDVQCLFVRHSGVVLAEARTNLVVVF